VQVTTMPPTHILWPHASVRRSPSRSTTQVQSSLDDDVHPIAATETAASASASAARAARGTTEAYPRRRPRAPLAFVVSVLALLQSTTAWADGLRIEDAVRLALQNNERARKAPLRVEIAEGQLDRARDAFFPTIIGSGVTVYRPDPPARSPSTTTSGTVTLNQPLLNPSAFAQFAQQKHTRESEKWGSVQDRRQLAFDTAKAFIQALALEGVLISAQRKADTAKLNLEAARARADAGLTSVNDVTKTELQLATSLGQLATAEGNVAKTYINLSFLVGQKVAPPLVPPDNTTRAAQRYEESQRNQVKSALDRRAEALKAAQNRRPDLRSLHERTEALRSSANEPLYRLIPSLSAAGQLRFVPDPLPSEKPIDEQVSVNLTWPIFDAGFRYADRRQRLAQLESSELDEKLLQRSVQADLEIALASLRAARTNFKAANDAVAAAQKNTDETLILYKQGLAKAIEVNDANDRQFETEVTRESAKLTMEQAYLDLRNALGFGPLDDDAGMGEEGK
jgi:outer membrane protein TolC